ncbi:Oligopeptide/dipeptide transporter, C-terminal region [Sulfitobacter marinus]|uniref:Oligopeptide/dipeptide transporter, C-terminal region n=1 Tax=Sulfitobacter marinus TaxID=394264 RepID=A0A1I6QZV7_9RHOB|nr:oligopeptide/dipeptide ABC transporter ATP-binding protein [Sulfitobacter marinus]SFS57953.1 Oligopeptide/dipeptide transporter, C-terminal region [Sulfitobacter marinus]
MTDDIILDAVDLVKNFGDASSWLSRAPVVQAVSGVSLQVRRGETFAIVGESGCGKSTLARALMRLLAPTSGKVLFDGNDISDTRGADLRKLRKDMQFIFQDPFSSLNPRMSVGKLVGEPLEVHAPELSAQQRRDRVADLLRRVGLRAEYAGRYPHEFSGGQRQRIGIARALASGPKLIIGDEPVSALDVSVQAQVINLLGDLSRDMGLTLVIIAHDLAVIRHMSDRVAVMYLGQIVESGPTAQVYDSPRHPYTQALLASIPVMGSTPGRDKTTVLGEMPSPAAPPQGCRFHTRCPHAQAICKTDRPALEGDTSDGHQVACHFWDSLASAAPLPNPQPKTKAAEARFALYRAAVEGGTVKHNTEQ